MRDLTQLEIDTLEMICERLTVKEMAGRQGVSLSAINQRISRLKHRFEVPNHRELAIAYQQWREQNACSETTCIKNQLSEQPSIGDPVVRDDLASPAVLQDSMTFQVTAPWAETGEPRVVPRLLDGEHAGVNRFVAVLVAAALILVLILIGLGVAQGLTEALRGIR